MATKATPRPGGGRCSRRQASPTASCTKAGAAARSSPSGNARAIARSQGPLPRRDGIRHLQEAHGLPAGALHRPSQEPGPAAVARLGLQPAARLRPRPSLTGAAKPPANNSLDTSQPTDPARNDYQPEFCNVPCRRGIVGADQIETARAVAVVGDRSNRPSGIVTEASGAQAGA